MHRRGRTLYVATRVGVQVFNPQGQHLGTIPTPLPAQAPAFAGRDKKTLYVVGGGAVYSVAMVAQGVQGRAKRAVSFHECLKPLSHSSGPN